MKYREALCGVMRELEEYRDYLQTELKAMPAGYLNVRSYNGKEYYTWQIPEGGRRKKTFRKGITKDKEKVNLLVKKRYLESEAKVTSKKIEAIAEAVQKYEMISMQDDMLGFIKKHPELADALDFQELENKLWASDYERPADFYESGLKSMNSDGGRMRSKGEIIIASRLEHFGIPYRYESVISESAISRVPDFVIKRPRDGKIFYWEHLGLVNDREYMASNSRKFDEYERAGIVPWDNLIVTYDQADGGIDVKKIDEIGRAHV